MKRIKHKIETLRQHAIKLIKTRPNDAASIDFLKAELVRTVQMLDAHQVKINAQNVELIDAKLAIRDAINLYDFAPISYYTLSKDSKIVNINVVGAQMVGKEPSQAINTFFDNVITADTKPIFQQFMERVFSSNEKETCNITLCTQSNAEIFVHLTGIVTNDGLQCLITAVDFSKYKMEHEKVHQSEAKFRSIFETIQDIYYEATIEGVLTEVSPSIETVFKGQYTRNELIGSSLIKLYANPQDRSLFVSELFKKGKVTDYELLFTNKDGSIIQMSASSILKLNEDGTPLKIIGSLRDISTRKLAEKTLMESEQKYRTLANSGQALIWTSGLDMGCNYFNQVWLDFTGRTLEQEYGNGWAEGVHPDDFDKCLEVYTTAFKKQESFSMIYRVRRHDGEYRWLLDDGKPRYNSQHEFVGYIGHCLDITEQQLAEKARLKSEEKYRFMFANNPQPMCIIDYETYRFLEVNQSIMHHYGYTKEDFLSMSINDIRTKGTIQSLMVDAVITNATQPENAQVLECEHLKKNGEIIQVEIIAHEISFNFRKAFHILINDVTERKLAESKLQESEALYHSILLASPDSIVITDLDGIIQFTSPSTLYKFGYDSAQQFVSHHLNEFLIPEDRERAQTDILQMYKGIYSTQAEYRALRLDNSIFDIDVKAKFINNAEGTPTKIIYILRDISERKKAEQIRNQQLFFSKALNEIAEIIISYDSPVDILEKANTVLGKALQVDRTLIYDMSLDRNEIVGLCEWRRLEHPDIKSTKGVYPLEMFKDAFWKIWNEKELFISHSDNVNEYLTHDGSAEILHKHMQIKSLLWYPFRFQEKNCHLFTLNQILEPREWTAEEIDFLESVSKHIELALEKISLLDESKKIQHELEISEERFSQVVEQSQEVVWEVDKDGLYTYVSPMALQIYGYTPAEMIGKMYFYDLFPIEERELLKQDVFDIFEKKEITHNFINTIVNKQGVDRIMSTNGIPMISATGDLIGYRGLDADITEAKMTERSLRESESKFRSITEQTSDFIAIADENGFITYASSSCFSIFHLLPNEMCGRNFVDFVANADISRAMEDFSSMIKGEAVLKNKEYAMKRADGTEFFGEINGTTFLSEKLNGVLVIIRDITERVNADKELRRLSQVVEQSPVSIMITNTQGLIVYANAKTSETTGYSNDFLLGENPRLLNSFEMKDSDYLKIWQTISAGKDWHDEFRNMKKSGELYWVSTLVSPIFDAKGEIINYLSIQEDITERKKNEQQIIELNETLEIRIKDRTTQLAETNKTLLNEIEARKQVQDALSKSENNYRTVVENVNDIIFQTDTDGLWTYLNKSWELVTGFSVDECIGQSFTNFVHPEDKVLCMALFEPLILRKKEYCRTTVRYLTKDGKSRWVEVFGRLGLNENNEITGAYGTLHDITERKNAEIALFTERQRLASIVEGTNVGTWEWNIKTGETVFNERWANIVGFTLDELADINIEKCFDITDPDDLVLTKNLLEKHFKGEIDYYDFETKIKHKDGRWIWVNDRGKVHKWDENGNALLMSGTRRDITTRKMAEEETLKAKQEAENANTAKSEFLSRMSHELRTPLNSILGFAQLLALGELNPKQEKGINHILKSGQHLLSLINEVLDISRIEAGKLMLITEPIALKSIVEEVLDSIQPLIFAKHLTVRLDDSFNSQMTVLADRKALNQILINLLNNATKYNKEGGSITVNANIMPLNDVGVIPVRISITDTGLGISDELINKLFVPFERIGAEKTQTEGSGLGLTVVKKLIDAMEGSIGIESKVGVGSTFWIELPLMENH